MASSHLNLADVLDKVQSPNADTRKRAVSDLKHILESNKRENDLAAIRKEKVIHPIFEVLAKIISKDKAAWVNSTKPTAKAAVASRLALYASTFRYAVEILVQRLRFRTLNLLLHHIIDVLPLSTGGFCEPIHADYSKTLKVILSYPAHVEHLRPDDWSNLVDFCLDGLTVSGEQDDFDSPLSDSFTVSRSGRNMGTNGLPLGLSMSRQKRSGDAKIAGIFPECLALLVAAENAPILLRSSRIIEVIIPFMSSLHGSGDSALACFETVNSTLFYVSLNSSFLLQRFAFNILHLIRQLWHQKGALRDQMLITIILLQSHLQTLQGSNDTIEGSTTIDELFEEIKTEISRAEQRDRRRLQVSDIDVAFDSTNQPPTNGFSIATATLKRHASAAESSWTQLNALGFLAAWHDIRIAMKAGEDDVENIPSISRKRRRLSSKLDEVLRQCLTGRKSERSGAVQILAFLICKRALSTDELSSMIKVLLQLMPEPDHDLASWALIATAECAAQTSAQSPELRSQWSLLWDIAVKLVTSQPHCAAACHLLLVLRRAELVEPAASSLVLHSMLSSTILQGPALLCDSACHMLNDFTLLQASLGSGQPIDHWRKGILSWIIARWNPSSIENRAHISILSQQLDPSNLAQLLRGHDARNGQSYWAEVSRPHAQLGKALSKRMESECLLQYLNDPKGRQPLGSSVTQVNSTTVLPRDRPSAMWSSQTRDMICDFVTGESQKLFDNLKDVIGTRPMTLGTDIMISAVSFCIASNIVLNELSAVPSSQLRTIRDRLLKIIKAMLQHLEQSRDITGIHECFVEPFAALLPALEGCTAAALLAVPDWIKSWAIEVDVVLRRVKSHINDTQPDDMDDMDIEGDTQRSRTNVSTGPRMPRNLIDARHNKDCLNKALSYYVHLVASIPNVYAEEDELAETLDNFAQYLASCSSEDLVSSLSFVRGFVNSHLPITTASSTVLLECYFSFVEMYDHERCETSLILGLTLMHAYLPLWTAPGSDSDVVDIGAQLYGWFVGSGIGHQACSPTTQAVFSDLLFALLATCPEYGQATERPSIRTTLFDAMSTCGLPVKFHIIQRIPEIFGMFVLQQHENIFDDIQDNLPRDIDWREGMAIRLLAMCQIASRWKTLLRRCVYSIFETAAHVRDAHDHATYCVKTISDAQNIEASRLFELFSPQILYTWLQSGDLNLIPYSVFGFSSLRHLLVENQDELVGQLMMLHPDTTTLSQVAALLERSTKELVIESFDLCAAYAVLRDASSKASGGKPSRAVESRLRAVTSDKKYLALLHERHSAVIGHIFRRIDDEEQVEKALEALEGAKAWLIALGQIRTLSGSTVAAGMGQQPSFKGKYLAQVLDLVCRRSNSDLHEVWTPTNISTIARMLIEDLHPALGSLNAVRVIRKLRLLVCLAGPEAFNSYVLCQIIQALQNSITDDSAAEDSIGLVQYLMDHGRHELVKDCARLAMFSLGMLMSIRLLDLGSIESTTQESQRRAVRLRSGSFATWLQKYMQSFKGITIDGKPHRTFNNIIHLTQQLSNPSEESSMEAEVLKILLEDMALSEPLFSEPSLELLLASCNSDSGQSLDSISISVDSESAAQSIASQVWRVSQLPTASEAFHAWAARFIGQVFADTGRVPSAMVKETNTARLIALSAGSPGVMASRVALVKILTDLLAHRKQHVVSLAENALRHLLNGMKGEDAEAIIEERIPHAIVKSLKFSVQPTRRHFLGMKIAEGGIKVVCNSFASTSANHWTQQVVVSMLLSMPNDPIMASLLPLSNDQDDLASKFLPYIVHVFLLTHSISAPDLVVSVSHAFEQCLRHAQQTTLSHKRVLLDVLLYLRLQSFPDESTRFDRNHWLPIDMGIAASAAAACNMHKTAMMLTEIRSSQIDLEKRRTSKAASWIPHEMLLSISENIDEPDMFYGVPQKSDLDSIAKRFEYEAADTSALLLRGLQFDSLRGSSSRGGEVFRGEVLHSLNQLHLNSLVLQFSDTGDTLQPAQSNEAIEAAIKLQKWDIPSPLGKDNEISTVYRSLQALTTAVDAAVTRQGLSDNATSLYTAMTSCHATNVELRRKLTSLAALAEMREVLETMGADRSLVRQRARFDRREKWMREALKESTSRILSSRIAVLSILAEQSRSQSWVTIEYRNARKEQILAYMQASAISRDQGALQAALGYVTALSHMQSRLEGTKLNIQAAVNVETAKVLWARGEFDASTRMLQDVLESKTLAKSSLEVGRAGVLALLGHQASEARLEKPDDIMSNYLKKSLQELSGRIDGQEAGSVYHELATYCHSQLQSSELVSELKRSEKFQRRKNKEIRDLKTLLRSTEVGEQAKREAKRDMLRSSSWLKIDQTESNRLRETRQQFLNESLVNYLSSLAASDEHDTDVLRFISLWLENASDTQASAYAAKGLSKVPSRKFALLMNQIASRVQNKDDAFHNAMSSLVERICREHPYHGMYHIYAGCKTTGGNDATARSRNAAAEKLAARLMNHPTSSWTWKKIHDSCEYYTRLASLKSDEMKAGAKLKFGNYRVGQEMMRDIPKLTIPPITLDLELRSDFDYSQLPTVTKFSTTMSIAGGLSAPKIVTVYASNGSRLKQLFKAGSDDLRQDAIMEQVFEQGSAILNSDKLSRQRSLKVRTYKVIPLTATSGAIEFVDNTISLNDFLSHAHERYHPDELKWSACRKKVSGAERLEYKARLETYEDITRRFSPVLRHFFFERFLDPERWFEARLAYTRSTAAISILGHILGLGDRHCQNILLDQETGEVVHIDLGVAFEAGRILNVPEVVPFRLTRDVVDGFGILKTEGVFRRCCEFTLEALRHNKDVIMTVLNVLRYDPLYQWSMSPLRAKKLQEEQDKETSEPEPSTAQSIAVSRSKRSTVPSEIDQDEGKIPKEARREDDDEGGEADRALTTVERKLAPGLSVAAAVNELIQQATDERNLAVLFCGWAAYA